MLPPDVDNRHSCWGCVSNDAVTLPPEVDASIAPVAPPRLIQPPDVCARMLPETRSTEIAPPLVDASRSPATSEMWMEPPDVCTTVLPLAPSSVMLPPDVRPFTGPSMR